MCQQCQATLRKGHILIFLVCFSVDVPEAQGLCCWSELAGTWQSWHPSDTQTGTENSAWSQGLPKKPLSPVPPGASKGSLLAHTSWGRGASTQGFHGAHSQTPVGLFTWRFSSPTELPVCNPAFPTTLSCLYITFYLRGSYLYQRIF